MKRFIIATVLLTFCFATTLICEKKAESAVNEMIDILHECEKKETSTNLDSAKVNEAIRMWKEKEKFLTLITPNDNFSDIENNFAALAALSGSSDFELSSSLCRETALILVKIADEYNISIENIF